MPCSWKGKHVSCIALAMNHRLCGTSSFMLSDLGIGDEHSTSANGSVALLFFTFVCLVDSLFTTVGEGVGVNPVLPLYLPFSTFCSCGNILVTFLENYVSGHFIGCLSSLC